MIKFLLAVLFFSSALAAGPHSLPSNFKVCNRGSPDHKSCLREAVQSAFRSLVSGAKSLRVQSIDPLLITSLIINQGTGPVAISLDFKNVAITGIRDVEILSVDAQLTEDVKTITIQMKTEKSLVLNGHYKIDGKVLILPISGTGNSTIELLSAKSSIVLTGKTVVKDGQTYLVFNSVQFVLDPIKVKLNFENLFNGDKTLGDNMNSFLNENWPEVYGELRDPIQNTFASTMILIANQIFTKVPYESIFPQ